MVVFSIVTLVFGGVDFAVEIMDQNVGGTWTEKVYTFWTFEYILQSEFKL